MKKLYLIFGAFSILTSGLIMPAIEASSEINVSFFNQNPTRIIQVPFPTPTTFPDASSVPNPPLSSDLETNWWRLPSFQDIPYQLAKKGWDYTKKPLLFLAIAYALKQSLSCNVERAGHRAHLTQEDPITNLRLTITIHKNGWRNPIQLEIQGNNDHDCYNDFHRKLNENLTADQKRDVLTKENLDQQDHAILEENETYHITIEGTVTYQFFRTFTLTKESIVEKVQFDDMNGNKDEWIKKLWEKAITTRISSTWDILPKDLIPATGATYRATFKHKKDEKKGFTIKGIPFYLSNEFCTIEASSLPELKEKIINVLACHIIPKKSFALEVQISILTQKDRFVAVPIMISISTNPNDLFDIQIPLPPVQGYQPSFSLPFFLNPIQQQQEAGELYQKSFENMFREFVDEEEQKEPIIKQIAKSIIFVCVSWKLLAEVAGVIRTFH